MSQGLHVVAKRKAGKPLRWYVYAYRGGPLIHKAEGPRPKITAAIADAAAEARRARLDGPKDGSLIASLVKAFRSPETPEWARLAKSTRTNYETWLDRIVEEFGEAPISAFEDRRARGDILAWRDRWADKPRAADVAIATFSRLLSWGVDRGRLTKNIATGIGQLYRVDRSEVIWETADFEAFNAVAPVEVREGVELAALTGLRRGDFVKLPWAAVGAHAIVWRTAKSRGRNLATVPLLPETKALLERIRARHAAEMATKPAGKRKPLPATVLSNSRWQPWTPTGFGSRFNDAKVESKIDKHLHDLRGTFVTRCMLAGLNDREIGDIVGWDTSDIASIRARYADQARVVIAIGERLSKVSAA